MQDTRRKRIVIDLDPKGKAAATAAGRKRRWPKVVAILVVFVVAVMLLGIGAGFLWWQRYKTTPAYSLVLLIKSFQQNSQITETFDQLVNTDKIVNDLTSQVSEKAAGRYGSTITPTLRQQLDGLLPNLLPDVKQKVTETVRTTLANQLAEVAKKAGNRPSIVLALTLPYFVNITSQDDTAKALVSGPDRTTELTLQRNAERWQVTGIKDDALVSRILDDLAGNLPTIGQPLAPPAARDPFRSPVRRRRR